MRIRHLLLLVPLLASTGCYHIRYVTHARPQGLPAAEQWHHDVIYGLIDLSGPVSVSKICPTGFAAAEQQVTFANALASLLLDGAVTSVIFAADRNPATGIGYTAPVLLWSPQTVTVYCAQRGGGSTGDNASLEFSGESSGESSGLLAPEPLSVTEQLAPRK